MCKYCKNLKRIKDLCENDYQKVLSSWKRRNYQAEKLLCMLALALENYGSDSDLNLVLISKVKKFCSTPIVGK